MVDQVFTTRDFAFLLEDSQAVVPLKNLASRLGLHIDFQEGSSCRFFEGNVLGHVVGDYKKVSLIEKLVAGECGDYNYDG